MRDPNRQRIDYSPCPAAKAALEEASQFGPALSKQALIDKMVICGLWALKMDHSRPPALFGTNRAYWRRSAGSEKAKR